MIWKNPAGKVENPAGKNQNTQVNNEKKREFAKHAKYVLAVASAIALVGVSIFFYNNNKKIDDLKAKQAEIVYKQKEGFQVLAEGSIEIAEELKKAKDGALPVVYLREEMPASVLVNYDNYSMRDSCNADEVLVRVITTPLTIDPQGKKGDTSFIDLVNKSFIIQAGDGKCDKKDNVIECSDLKTIETICEQTCSPGCRGGALANLTGEIKEKIKSVALKFYSSLLGNGSCDKGNVVLVDANGNKAVVVGYNESEMPEATQKGGDCYRAPGAVRPSIVVTGTK